MGLFVKICGMAHAEDVKAVAALGPDAMGFIFWPKSKRAVTPEQVAAWTRFIPEGILKVGVFVNAPPGDVKSIIEQTGLDVAQLHGDESPEEITCLPMTTWKAVHLNRADPETLTSYRVDAFLVDSYSAASPGGTGTVSDWDLAKAFVDSQETQVLLAGGLSPENVREAIAKVSPWGVDVVSGVEAEPGKKDLKAVEEFIKQCRNS